MNHEGNADTCPRQTYTLQETGQQRPVAPLTFTIRLFSSNDSITSHHTLKNVTDPFKPKSQPSGSHKQR